MTVFTFLKNLSIWILFNYVMVHENWDFQNKSTRKEIYPTEIKVISTLSVIVNVARKKVNVLHLVNNAFSINNDVDLTFIQRLYCLYSAYIGRLKTSPQSRCSIMTLHRRWGDVVYVQSVLFFNGKLIHKCKETILIRHNEPFLNTLCIKT